MSESEPLLVLTCGATTALLSVQFNSMCTLSFVTRDDGYLVGMNRDESIYRARGAGPARIRISGIESIFPRDCAGGTWIAVNDRGITLVLLNWNDVAPPKFAKSRTRGEVIPALIDAASFMEVADRLDPRQGQRGPNLLLPLEGLFPFRLVGVFGAERRIVEWKWDGNELSTRPGEWVTQHWFSSSASDEKAEAERGRVCWSALQESDRGSSTWLQRLHASHGDGPGAFSICVHRENVRTLSYSEVSCSGREIVFRYLSGSPCEPREPGIQLSIMRA